MNPRYSAQIRFVALLAVLSTTWTALSGCSSKITDSTVERISVTDTADRVRKSGDSVLILDTRSPADYAAGHVPGARNIALPEVDETDPDPSLRGHKMIIVYGQNPGSGAAMALSKRLLAAEIGTVRLMEDGFSRWKDSGLPVQTPK